MQKTVLLVMLLAGAGIPAAASDKDRAQGQGRQYLQDWLTKRGMSEGDMAVEEPSFDPAGGAHLRARQRHRGVPVFGGECIVHINPDGSLFGVTDSIVPGPDVDNQPRLSRREAIEIAMDHHGCRDCYTRRPEVDLWVLRQGERDRLVYRVQLFREDETQESALPVYQIDAHDGEIVSSYDNLQTATVTGTGTSLYNGAVSFTAFQNGATFYLEDVTRRLGTFDFHHGTSAAARCTDADNSWVAGDQRAAVEAHYAATQAYAYYRAAHFRDGINGAGGPFSMSSIDGSTGLLASRVHYSNGYNNAFWNGQTLTFGDGDGSTFGPLITLDIVGHEWTHGVIGYTAGLVYSGESGALNESIADVFGAMVERHARGENEGTWRFGEDAFTPTVAGDAFRYLDAPHAASNSGFTADDDPDHYSERYTGSLDNGGVHVNAGIPSKAFHLLAQGGRHHLGGGMAGIGADAAARIWYRALTTFLTSTANFAAARTATLNAASAIHGVTSAEVTAVAQAWCMVGVGACPGSPVDVFKNGGLEGSLTPSAASGAGALYTVNGTSPHTGTGYAYFGNGNSASGQTFQQISIPITATSANLSFWLNVTSAETTTAVQFDKLFVEVRSTTGTLLATLATFSNLDKGALGAYSQKGSYSLLAFKGQTVRLQFRVLTDSTAVTTFRVDDVAVN